LPSTIKGSDRCHRGGGIDRAADTPAVAAADVSPAVDSSGADSLLGCRLLLGIAELPAVPACKCAVFVLADARDERFDRPPL
jgi:hypothetical protein